MDFARYTTSELGIINNFQKEKPHDKDLMVYIKSWSLAVGSGRSHLIRTAMRSFGLMGNALLLIDGFTSKREGH